MNLPLRPLLRPVPFTQPIYVARPHLPALEKYQARLEKIWTSGWLANNGAQHQELEKALSAVLGAPHLSLFNNGTIGLMLGCKALGLSGEVITTPFTFPATAHVLNWNNITPIFADIDPDTLTLAPAAIEPLITAQTSGILGVHVYGVPCDVQGIEQLARPRGLKVIYDGAHAFGTTVNGQPIAAFGDMTMYSFHATKLFHTAEGGALAVQDPAVKQRLDLLKNFGIKNEDEVILPGINGKMNELQAALGLALLDEIADERARRAQITALYRERLGKIDGLRLIEMPAGVTNSYQYQVVRVDAAITGMSRDALHESLKTFNIITRKYFYPLCSQYSCYQHLPSAAPQRLPNAHRVAREVLTLPLFSALTNEDVHRICDAINYCLAIGVSASTTTG